MEGNNQKITKEELMEEISALKTRIKNTEYDLTHMFKGNSFLEQKLEISKKSLGEKIRILEDLSSNPDKTQKIKDFEDEVTEKEEISISQDQEEALEEEIEEELEK
jgi:hypothetical protein